MEKILVALRGDEVANRFDMAPEVWIAAYGPEEGFWGERTVVLPQASAEQLCQLVVSEGVDTLVCGGIEQEYYEYLTWKKVRVIDFVVGSLEDVKRAVWEGTLEPGAVLLPRDLEE